MEYAFNVCESWDSELRPWMGREGRSGYAGQAGDRVARVVSKKSTVLPGYR
jgi:hypothetical protein